MGATGFVIDPDIAFRSGSQVRVNFGVLNGRAVTNAEIDDLARELHPHLPQFSILAEDRHEFGERLETSVHQVVIEAEEVDDAIVDIAYRWAQACYASRYVEY
jgi:hypothetical protein